MEQPRSRIRLRDRVRSIWSSDDQAKKGVQNPSSSRQSPPLDGPSQFTSNGDGTPSREPSTASRPRSLWDDAYDKIISSSESKDLEDFAKILREDIRVRSKFDEGNIQGLSAVATVSPELNICRQVLRIVLEHAYIPQQKQWHVLSKDTTIKKYCGEIAASVQKFVDVGDIVSQVDPIHIGLPWAGIRLVLLASFLQLAIRSQTTDTIIYQGLGTIARLVYVYHIFEDYYLRNGCPVEGNLLEGLKQNLVILYGSMVLFILEAQLYFRQRSATRTLTATAKMGRLQGILDEIAKNEELIHRFERLHLKNDANENYLAMRKFLGSYDDNLQETLRNEIVAWISDMDYRGHHKVILERLTSGTGQWLFQKAEYIRWQRSTTSSLLWLRGDAGIGKSTLMASVIDRHETKSRFDSKEAFAYVYCSRTSGDARRQNPVDLMRCLIQQLSCPMQGLPLKPAVVKKYNIERSLSNRPGLLTLTECQELILELLKFDYNRVTIIIDALDECQSQQREKLLRFLTRLLVESNAILKILVSSRDGTEIAHHFDTIGSLYIDASDNEADIRQYVEVQIESRLLSGKASHEMKSRVKSLLYLKAQGMFRWVELQIESLCDPDYVQCEADVEYTISELPQTLEATYLESLAKIKDYRGPKRVAIQNAFKLLLCAERTLEVDELLGAVSVGLDGQLLSLTAADIARMSRGLIAVNEELRIYRFALLSVREFLEKQPDYSEELSHASVATICLYQFGTKAFLETARTSTIGTWANSMFLGRLSLGFMEYAFHIGDDTVVRLALKELVGIFKNCYTLSYSGSRYPVSGVYEGLPVELNHCTNSGFRPLFAICIYGFVEMIDGSVACTRDVLDCFNMTGMNPLEVAAYHDNYELTKELLSRALDTGTSPEWSQSLLEKAAVGGTNTMITKFLLQELQHTAWIEDVIIIAACNGEHGTEMVQSIISVQPGNFSINAIAMEAVARTCRTPEAFQTCLEYYMGEITSGVAKATAGNVYLSLNCMKILLSRDTSFVITEELAIYFVQRGQKFVELLFVHCEDLAVTSKMLQAALSHFFPRESPMATLLSKARSRHVDEPFLTQLAMNKYLVEIMAMITEPRPTFKLVKPVLEVAMRDTKTPLQHLLMQEDRPHLGTTRLYSRLEILKALLEREPYNEVTEEMLEMVASRLRISVMELLLEQPRAFPLTLRMFSSAVRNLKVDKADLVVLLSYMTKVEPSEDHKILALSRDLAAHQLSRGTSNLLDRLGSCLITETVILAALKSNRTTTKVLDQLFLQAKTVEVSSDMLLIAAGLDEDILVSLLKRAGSKTYITEDMIKMSACKSQNLQILLSQPQRARASEASLEAAAAVGDLSTLRVLLGTSEMEVNKGKLITTASSNVFCGSSVVRWLLSSGKVDISEDAFLSAAKNRGLYLQGFDVLKLNHTSGREIMGLLLSQSSKPAITTNVLVAAAANPLPLSLFSVLEVVLEHLCDDYLITEDVLASAAGNANFGVENLQLLLARYVNGDADEVMLRAAAVSELPEGYNHYRKPYIHQYRVDEWPVEHVMEYLVERPAAQISEEVIRLAAGNRTRGRQLMRVLLSHPGNRVLISPSIALSAASNPEHGDMIMKILIDERSEEIEITTDLILAADANETRGKAILQRLLGMAAEKGDKNALRMLVENIRSEPDGVRDALFQVAYRGQMKAVKFLLDEGANLHDEIEGIGNVLHVAAFRGQPEIVRFLITQGVNVNALGGPHSTALNASLHRSHLKIAEMLMEAGASLENEDLDPMGRTALHRAVKADKVTLVDNLLQAGANIFSLDSQKCSALHLAAAARSIDIAKTLIASGICVLQSDSFGWTPLHWAARSGDAEISEVLLLAGASKEATDCKGKTPFEIAVFFQNKNILSALCMTTHHSEPVVGRERYAICDGCGLIVFGDLYKCDTCDYFNFCYRCIIDAEDIHNPNHNFILVLYDEYKSFLHSTTRRS
ncbi:hypothetical protein MMC11_004632 [Xylographa trunciseda]|nr:hypothetical protein [Xylographa trunciseda]